ncbi:hypothetical protein P0F65_03895 [Sphingomonas sp. I4]
MVYPKTIGWPEGRTLVAPRGWQVTKFAGGLDHPRQALILPNGDVIVAEARTQLKPDVEPEQARARHMARGYGFSANRLTLLRDADGDGIAEQRHVLREGLNQPFGMQYADGRLYVANTDAVLSFPIAPARPRSRGRRARSCPCPLAVTTTIGPATCYSRPMAGRCMSRSARPPMLPRTGWTRKSGARRFWRSIWRADVSGFTPRACATRWAWTGRRGRARCGRRSTSATIWATTSRPTIWSGCVKAALWLAL